MNWFELTNLLSRPIAFHQIFAKIGGGTCCGVFLSQAFYWTPRTADPDGWFYKSQIEWEEETALTRYEQETVRKRLKERGLIEEKKEGVPCKLFYRINKEKLMGAIAQFLEGESKEKPQTFTESQFGGKQQASCGESNKQAAGKATSKSVENQQTYLYTETTSETTADIFVAAKEEKKQENCQPTDCELDKACRDISRVSPDVETNIVVRKAILQYWANFPAALSRLKKAVNQKWRCNLTGVLVKALKEGVAEVDAEPVTTGFGDWFTQGQRRGILSHSQACGSDIRVYLNSGVSRLWSEIKSLSWEDLVHVCT